MSIASKLLDVPMRQARARLPEDARRLNPEAGEVLDLARGAVRLEPKQMADDMSISHSLVLRGLKSADHLSFHRLWELPDAFWVELILLVAQRKRLGQVQRRVIVDLDRVHGDED